MRSPFERFHGAIDNEALNARGWFEPYSGVLYLKEISPKGVDPDSVLAQEALHSGRSFNELRNELRAEFLKQPDSVQREWKKIMGVSDNYDPAKNFLFWVNFENAHGSQEVFSSGHVTTHEYCHYIQFMRTMASPMLIWAFMKLIVKTNALFSYMRQFPQKTLEFPIAETQDKNFKSLLNDPAVDKIFEWHFMERDSLSANIIREAEAEFTSVLFGKQPIRFRDFTLLDHPITIHFRDLYKTSPNYARAYLEAEASLGRLTPSLFPLITYYALSMPLKKVSFFRKEDFEPVHSGEAFRAAIDYLKQDFKRGYEYAKYAQSLYEETKNQRSFPSPFLKQFCVNVSKQNGWIYPSDNLRMKWILSLDDPDCAFVTKLGKLFYEAFILEKKYGGELFSEPFSNNHNYILSEIPFPPIAFPNGNKIYLTAEDFWGKEDVEFWMAEIHVRMGAAFSIFISAETQNDCPHVKCPVRKLNLCHLAPTFPNTYEECKFPRFLEDWSGIPLSNFRRRN